MSGNQKNRMKSLAERKGNAPGEAANQSSPGKQADGKTGSLALTLIRTVQLKRYPIIARVTFLRERPDLVSLLKSMQNNPADMPPRLKQYLKQETLWYESGITDKGQQVIDSGLFEAKERGLYHIWYTENDPLLGIHPTFIQRDTAFFEPNMQGWKKGSDAARSKFRVDDSLQLRVLEESFADRNKTELKNISLQIVSLEPEVICSPEKSAEIHLEWRLGFSASQLSLKGQLDMLQFNQNKTSSRLETFELSIDDFGDRLNDVMTAIAGEFDGNWLPKEALKKPVFRETAALYPAWLLGSIFREMTFSDHP